MAKERGQKAIAQNRRARYDYHIDETYEAGLVLTGTEVKALRAGRASLTDAYAVVLDGEVWLQGAHIPEYSQGTWTNHAPRRSRKLLLHRQEIARLADKASDTGFTLIPLSLYFSDGRAKVELALARGKKEYDKRHAIADREAKRDIERAVSRQLRGQRGA